MFILWIYACHADLVGFTHRRIIQLQSIFARYEGESGERRRIHE